MGSPTDSVVAPRERQPVGALTALSALVLLAFLALMAWLQYGGVAGGVGRRARAGAGADRRAHHGPRRCDRARPRVGAVRLPRHLDRARRGPRGSDPLVRGARRGVVRSCRRSAAGDPRGRGGTTGRGAASDCPVGGTPRPLARARAARGRRLSRRRSRHGGRTGSGPRRRPRARLVQGSAPCARGRPRRGPRGAGRAFPGAGRPVLRAPDPDARPHRARARAARRGAGRADPADMASRRAGPSGRRDPSASLAGTRGHGGPDSRRGARRDRARCPLRVFGPQPRAAGHAADARNGDQSLLRARADPHPASPAGAAGAGLRRRLRADPGRRRRTTVRLRVPHALRARPSWARA